MSEELLEINENDEVTNIGVNQTMPEEVMETQVMSNPFLDYIQSVFVKERFEEYMNSLNEDQKKFILTFSRYGNPQRQRSCPAYPAPFPPAGQQWCWQGLLPGASAPYHP